MSFTDRLAQALPKQDVNGDTFEFIPRARVFDELHGLITPYKHRIVSVEDSPTVDPHASTIPGRLLADLNTEEGRAAFLECWWPTHVVDGYCLAVRAEHGREDGLPYPTFTLLRRASFRHLLAPDTLFDVMRLGSSAFTGTTTSLKAHWDCGIRRSLIHPTENYNAWLRWQIGGLSPRLTRLDPDDPLRTWTWIPGHPGQWRFAYFLEVPDRPQTDDFMAWMRGAP